jgi:hypothetical protein
MKVTGRSFTLDDVDDVGGDEPLDIDDIATSKPTKDDDADE